MSELVTMYPAQANSPETSLSGALTAAGTTVNVVDGSVLPEAPNLLTIGADGSTAETVLMTAKNGNVLTVVRGQDGTTARAWSAGDVIGRYFTAADQKAMQDNITALNNGKTEKVTSPTDGNLVAFDGTTGKQKDSGKKPGDFAGGLPPPFLEPYAGRGAAHRGPALLRKGPYKRAPLPDKTGGGARLYAPHVFVRRHLAQT